MHFSRYGWSHLTKQSRHPYDEHILKLPTQLHSMIFDYLTHEKKPWLGASLTFPKSKLLCIERSRR